jgi:GNAT superfamily N-acetyltransferase
MDMRTVRIRAVGKNEAHLVDEVFAGMSVESRYKRFLSGTSRLTPAQRRLLADVDGYRHQAWVAEALGKAVGLARYIRPLREPKRAELAFEVADAYHGRGVGSRLLEVVLAGAREAGIEYLECTIAPDNVRAINLTRRLPDAKWRWEDGLMVGTARLSGKLIGVGL